MPEKRPTLSLRSFSPVNQREGLSSGQSCRSPDTENPADAGFLLDGFRPGKDIPVLHLKVRNAAEQDIQERSGKLRSAALTDPHNLAKSRPLRCVGLTCMLGINPIRDSMSNWIDVGVGIVRLTLLKRQNRGILNHATINIHSPSNGLILLPTITARHHGR